MKDPNNKSVPPGREAWVKGKSSTEEDAFAERAASGRRYLNSAEEADELLRELDADIEDAYGSLEKKDKPLRHLPVGRRRYSWLAWAAAILLLVLAGMWWSNQSKVADSEQLFADQFEHFTNDLVIRTMGDETDDSKNGKQQALEAYEKKDYAQATEDISQYLASTTRVDSSLYFYLGISELAQGRVVEAEQSLQTAAAFGYQPDAATWYLALVKLKAGQMEAAKADLKTITKGRSLFRERAKKLLELL